MKEIADASMQATESTVDVTPPQAATKRMAGMADGMAVWQTEWSNGGNGRNGQTAERMAEWQNGRMAGIADGMVEWQTEMATYVLFTVHTDDTDDNDDDDDDTLIFHSIDITHDIITNLNITLILYIIF